MNKTEVRCPLCHSQLLEYPVEKDVFEFLSRLDGQGILKEYLKICRVYIDILDQGAPTAAVATKAVNAIRSEICKVTSEELSKTTPNIILRVQETLKSQAIDPKDFEVLEKTLPELTLAINELLKRQYIPKEKGTEAEGTLRDELASYFPEDEIVHLGGSGETDILIQPRLNGVNFIEPILVESKCSKTWERSYFNQVRKHMQQKQSHYAILVVAKMPRGANGYLTEYFEEGTVFVTESVGCKTVYGALRAVLFSGGSLFKRSNGLKRAFSDNKISQAIEKALTSSIHFESIRKRSNTIITNVKAISQETDEAEKLLRNCLSEMQYIISEALTNEVPTGTTNNLDLLER